MQEIKETIANRQVIDRLAGVESKELQEAFRTRYDKAVHRLNKRLDRGEDAQLEVQEVHAIKRNDPCPCGSGVKFKRCCGKRLAQDDERIADD